MTGLIILLTVMYFIHIPLMIIGALYMKKKDEDLWSIANYFTIILLSFIPLLNIAGICILVDYNFFSWFTEKKY